MRTSRLSYVMVIAQVGQGNSGGDAFEGVLRTMTLTYVNRDVQWNS